MSAWTAFNWFGIKISDGSFIHGNETSCSTKCAEFLDQISDYKLLKKDSAPWSYFTFIRIAPHKRILFSRRTAYKNMYRNAVVVTAKCMHMSKVSRSRGSCSPVIKRGTKACNETENHICAQSGKYR
jgi:hypothetical protein